MPYFAGLHRPQIESVSPRSTFVMYYVCFITSLDYAYAYYNINLQIDFLFPVHHSYHFVPIKDTKILLFL